MKDDLSKYLRLTAIEEIVVTRHGRPAGVLIGCDSEEDWFDYRLEHHREFLTRIAAARAALAQGRGVPIEVLDDRIGLTSRWSRRPWPARAGRRVPARRRRS